MSRHDLSDSSLQYSPAEVERIRRFGDVTRSGVVFDSELAGPNGMSFVLIREDNTTTDMLQAAVKQLRCDRDVVGAIKVASISKES